MQARMSGSRKRKEHAAARTLEEASNPRGTTSLHCFKRSISDHRKRVDATAHARNNFRSSHVTGLCAALNVNYGPPSKAAHFEMLKFGGQGLEIYLMRCTAKAGFPSEVTSQAPEPSGWCAVIAFFAELHLRVR